MLTDQLSEVLRQIEGKDAWGLCRTHGSMFFLEIGKAVPVEDTRMHGEWHFLFESCHWRIEKLESLIVGSEDDQDFIDEVFLKLHLGQVEHVLLRQPLGDLYIKFDSGHILRTFSAAASRQADWTDWLFFTPHDLAWKKPAVGTITCRNIHDN